MVYPSYFGNPYQLGRFLQRSCAPANVAAGVLQYLCMENIFFLIRGISSCNGGQNVPIHCAANSLFQKISFWTEAPTYSALCPWLIQHILYTTVCSYFFCMCSAPNTAYWSCFF
jgi:hypothetical protein